jgi:hypothetical protein
MQDSRQTCEERIGAHLASRLADFRDFATLTDERAGANDVEMRDAADRVGIDTDAAATDDIADMAYERIYEYPLGIQTLRVHRIDISTGGPGDWLEAFVDDGEITRIVYHFNDWFDHAERTLDGAEFDTAARFVETLIPEL